MNKLTLILPPSFWALANLPLQKHAIQDHKEISLKTLGSPKPTHHDHLQAWSPASMLRCSSSTSLSSPCSMLPSLLLVCPPRSLQELTKALHNFRVGGREIQDLAKHLRLFDWLPTLKLHWLRTPPSWKIFQLPLQALPTARHCSGFCF